MEDLYAPDDAARFLGVSRATVYRLADDGRLPYYELDGGKGRRFRGEDLRALLFQDHARTHEALRAHFRAIHQELTALLDKLPQVAGDFGLGWETQVRGSDYWADVRSAVLLQMEAHHDLSRKGPPTVERLYDDAIRAAAQLGHQMEAGVKGPDTAYGRCKACGAQLTIGYPIGGGEITVVVDVACQAPCPALTQGAAWGPGTTTPADILEVTRRRRQAARSGRPFEATPQEIVLRFGQWEQAAMRSPNREVALHTLPPPTLEEAEGMLTRLRDLRHRLEVEGIDQHRRPPANLDSASMGWLWEEWRDRLLGDQNGYRKVWNDADDPLYGAGGAPSDAHRSDAP